MCFWSLAGFVTPSYGLVGDFLKRVKIEVESK